MKENRSSPDGDQDEIEAKETLNSRISSIAKV